MDISALALTGSATLSIAVEAVCPICNGRIAAESNETDIYCGDCKCVVFQLPIRINEFNHKGDDQWHTPRN